MGALPDPTQTRSAPSVAGVDESSNELRALSVLAFEDLAAFPGAIRDMHLGIAARAFAGVGGAGRPIQLVHDAISRGAYGAASAASYALGQAADVVLERSGVGEHLELSRTPGGSAAIAVLDGLIGDRLKEAHSELHQPASVRVDGAAVPLDDSGSLRAAFPAASSRPVVFLHGLMETEFSWSWGARYVGDGYGARLQEQLGRTPIYLRYNSGLHISENGRAVADLMERLCELWPVEVEELALVGHSMGGLVARSACHQGTEDAQRWCARVGHVISLGSPHLGAPLERAVHVAAAALDTLPETRMLSRFLRRRSAGIRDLRQGSLVDEDWRGRDPDALRSAASREVPLLAGATHCFVSASVTRSPQHPMGRLLGDMLVLVPSASGRGRTRRIPFDAGHHVGAAHHFALLNHPQVYAQLHGWLRSSGRAEPAGSVRGR